MPARWVLKPHAISTTELDDGSTAELDDGSTTELDDGIGKWQSSYKMKINRSRVQAPHAGGEIGGEIEEMD